MKDNRIPFFIKSLYFLGIKINLIFLLNSIFKDVENNAISNQSDCDESNCADCLYRYFVFDSSNNDSNNKDKVLNLVLNLDSHLGSLHGQMVGAQFREAVVGDDLVRVIEHLYHHPGQSRGKIARALGMAGAKLEAEIKWGCRLYGTSNLDQLFFRIVSESDECPDHPALNDDENQVLKCLADGLSRRDTATRLGAGLSKAKWLGKRIRLLLKCRGNMEAVMLALGQAGVLREFGDLFARFTGKPAAPAKKPKRG